MHTLHCLRTQYGYLPLHNLQSPVNKTNIFTVYSLLNNVFTCTKIYLIIPRLNN